MINKLIKLSYIYFVLFVLIIFGVCLFYYSYKNPNRELIQYDQRNIQTKAEKDIIGSWTSSIDGEEIMNFYIGDDQKQMFTSFSHGTQFLTGTWELYEGKLIVNFSSDMDPESMTFVSVSRTGNKLTLRSTDGKESIHYLVE